MQTAYLVLEDGTVFPGHAVGAAGVSAGEACFTTAATGYEEAVSDPSYSGQVLVFAYPLVGNYGVDERRLESARVWTDGVVMRRARPAWAAWLAARGVVALDEVDTRAVVRRIREDGAMRCALGQAAPEELHARALAQPHIDYERGLAEPELASPPLALRASTSEPFTVGAGPRVVVLDLGCKRSIVRRLVGAGVEAAVVPGTWTADQILALDPRAVLIGNGPGDPAQLQGPIETVRELLGHLPVFGICLGHQLAALALGMRTFKLPFGHRGANHPVRVRDSSRVLVTVQNHGFAVEPSDAAEVSYVSLNDGTVEGLEADGLATVQFHPEASPGPRDALPFFDRIAAECRSAQGADSAAPHRACAGFARAPVSPRSLDATPYEASCQSDSAYALS
jgi:carbamoyl-phosphate synthase small subunit